MKLAALMKTADVNVVVTRDSDIELADPSSKHKKLDDLNARIAIASENENSILVSIHMNKFPVSKYSGLQVYYSGNNEGSKALADMIQNGAPPISTRKTPEKQNRRGIPSIFFPIFRFPPCLSNAAFFPTMKKKSCSRPTNTK